MSRWSAFFKSGAGMLTAAATLLAAIAGLVTAVTQLRGDDGRAGAEAVTVVAGETAAERELRSYIPTAIRPTCGPPKYPEPNAVAAFNCTYREIVGLQYNLFASDTDLRKAVAVVRKRYGSRHDCGPKPLLCFVGDDGVASVVWTDEGADVLSFAWRDDGNLDALYESWAQAIAR